MFIVTDSSDWSNGLKRTFICCAKTILINDEHAYQTDVSQVARWFNLLVLAVWWILSLLQHLSPLTANQKSSHIYFLLIDL